MKAVFMAFHIDDDDWNEVYKEWMKKLGIHGYSNTNLSDYLKDFLNENTTNPYNYDFNKYIHRNITISVNPDDEESIKQAMKVLKQLLSSIQMKKQNPEATDEALFDDDFKEEWS